MKTKQMKKRIMSMILALVIGICCIVPAAPAMKTEAASMKDVAKKVTLGEYNQITLDGTNERILKIVLKSKGKFYLRSTMANCLDGSLNMELYDSNLRMLDGEYRFSLCPEISNDEFDQGDLKAGTYYVRIWNTNSDANPDRLTATYIATFFLEDFQISFFLEQLLKIAPNWIDFFLFNEMLMSMLGAIFNNCSKKKLIWKSSKKKVATVTSRVR